MVSIGFHLGPPTPTCGCHACSGLKRQLYILNMWSLALEKCLLELNTNSDTAPDRVSEKPWPLNAEFQLIARRDKKAFLRDQCKKIEENNRMGKTRDLFKKIRDTKGTFHAKMGSIKDRNGMDLIEAKDIRKRWQEYTTELYKKDLHDPDSHDGMITHLEPDILECEVK